jgi:site-specific DNA-methyltransferase (adenine-specific)
MQGGDHFSIGSGEKTRGTTFQPSSGRWPANLIHDGSEEVTGLFPQSKGFSGGGTKGAGFRDEYVNGEKHGKELPAQIYNDSGSAARFFYCAKANKKDRNDGLESFEIVETAAMQGNMVSGQRLAGNGTPIATPKRANYHPTVKPTDLMRYLCRLVTPKGGTVLDPFMGSGSTGKAAKLEGFDFIGIELDPEYCKIAEARINAA